MKLIESQLADLVQRSLMILQIEAAAIQDNDIIRLINIHEYINLNLPSERCANIVKEKVYNIGGRWMRKSRSTGACNSPTSS